LQIVREDDRESIEDRIHLYLHWELNFSKKFGSWFLRINDKIFNFSKPDFFLKFYIEVDVTNKIFFKIYLSELNKEVFPESNQTKTLD
jgi:hypothetical protein